MKKWIEFLSFLFALIFFIYLIFSLSDLLDRVPLASEASDSEIACFGLGLSIFAFLFSGFIVCDFFARYFVVLYQKCKARWFK